MTIPEVLLLGLIQGLTEFLPVSSSGHLAIVQMLLPGFEQPGVVFDAALHMGTAVAVVVFEREAISQWLRTSMGLRIGLLLGLATVATAASALPLRAVATHAFEDPLWVGGCLLVTAIVVLGTRWLRGGTSVSESTSWRQAVVVGLMQGAAVFPGLSRSGVTIASGLAVGLDRVWAARFSFLLSVPAVLGVATAEVLGQRHELLAAGSSFWLACGLGAAVAAVSGFFALAIVLRSISSRSFHLFGGYVLVVAVVVLVFTVVSP